MNENQRAFAPGKIIAKRKQLNIGQTALAKQAGINRGYLIDIEKGVSVPTASVLARLASALKVKESYFFINKVR